MAATTKLRYQEAMPEAYKRGTADPKQEIEFTLGHLGATCDLLLEADFLRADEEICLQELILPGFDLEAYAAATCPTNRLLARLVSNLDEDDLNDLCNDDGVYVQFLDWYLTKDPDEFIARLQAAIAWVEDVASMASESESSTSTQERQKQLRREYRKDERTRRLHKRPRYKALDRSKQ